MKSGKKLQRFFQNFKQSTASKDDLLKEYLRNKGEENYQVIPNFSHRTWPFWVNKQLGNCFDDNFSNLINTRHRNWTVLSDSFTNDHLLVDPSGLIQINKKPFSIDFWISNSNTLFTPSRKEDIPQSFDPNTGALSSSFPLSQIQVSTDVFFRKLLDSYNAGFCRYTLQNNASKKIKLSFYIVIRPYDIEGISEVNSIQYLQSQAFVVNNQLSLMLGTKPDNVVCLPHSEGDVSEHFNKLEMIFQADCKDRQASAFAEYRLIINPGESHHFDVSFPTLTKTFQPTKKASQNKLHTVIQEFNTFSFDKEKAQNQFRFSAALKNNPAHTLPIESLNTFINNQKTLLLFSIGKSELQSGFYAHLYQSPAQSIQILRAFVELGIDHSPYTSFFGSQHLTLVLKGLQNKQLTVTELGSWFETYAQLIQSQILSLEPDSKKIIDKIIDSAIGKQRKTPHLSLPIVEKRRSAQSGAEQWFLSDNLGLLESLNAYSNILDYNNLSTSLPLRRHRENVENSIRYFCDHVSNKVALQDIIPVSITQYGGLASLKTLLSYCQFFSDDSVRIENTLNLIQSQLIKDKLIHSIIHPHGFPIEENCHYIQLLCKLDPKSASASFEKLIALCSNNCSFPDVVHTQSKGGSDGEGHSFYAAALIIHTFMHLIVEEKENSIHLFKSCPDEWLEKENWSLPITHSQFGAFELSLTQKSDHTALSLSYSNEPETGNLCIYIPSCYQTARIDDKDVVINADHINVPSSVSNISLFKANS